MARKRKLAIFLGTALVVVAGVLPARAGQGGAQASDARLSPMPVGPLNPRPGLHIMPRTSGSSAYSAIPQAAGSAALAPPVPNITYWGGNVMRARTVTIPIFWEPPTLQSGSLVAPLDSYNKLIQQFFGDVGGHGMYDVLTQYYEQTPGRRYIVNSSFPLATSLALPPIVVTDNYPAATGGCVTDGQTNCITDDQIQTEIKSLMAAPPASYPPLPDGYNVMYLMFTDPGESSCIGPSAGFALACFHPVPADPNWVYCAYHSSFLDNASQPVMYANLPYIGTNAASVAGCSGGGPDPNKVPAFDDESSALSHEFSEAITDPDGFGWFDGKTGNEIADVCNQQIARVVWNGHPYIIQKEWSLATKSCQAGGGDELSANVLTGGAGSATTLTGARFKAREPVRLSFTSFAGHVTQLGTVAADALGRFTKRVNVPEGTPDGSGTFEAQGTRPGDGAALDFAVAGLSERHRPDARIGVKIAGPFAGNNIYNLTGARQHLRGTVARGQYFVFYLRVENDGNVPDTYAIRGSAAPAGFIVTYKAGATVVTRSVELGTYRVSRLNTDPPAYLKVIVKVRGTAVPGKIFADNLLVTSRGDPTKRDLVFASVKAG